MAERDSGRERIVSAGWSTELLVTGALVAVLFGAAIFWRAATAEDIEGARLTPDALADADTGRGQELFISYGCGTCHTVPGLGRADGNVGPSLHGFARRSFIAGQVANSPDNLVQWIVVPDSIAPGTAMPTIGVSEEDARHIAAFLYTLD